MTTIAATRRDRAPRPLSVGASRKKSFSVLIIGAGKVGTALHAALASKGVAATLSSARDVLRPSSPPKRQTSALLCVLAVRDSQIRGLAEAVTGWLPKSIPLVHTAGALGPEALEVAAARGFATGQMHPLLSFVSGRSPRFEGATLLVAGHPRAVSAARRLARLVGLRPRVDSSLPRPLYHAAAALLANGTAALAEASVQLLEAGGVERRDALAMTGPLLASVVENLRELGLPQALSGPVRRGDVDTFEAHWAAIPKKSRAIRALYLASVAMQIEMAKAIGEASPAALRALGERVTDLGASRRAAQSRPTPRIKKAQTISKPRKNRAKR